MARSAKPGTIRPLTRRGRKSAVVYLQVEKWRELKVIAALTDTTLDKLLESGADMVIEKFKRTRSGSLSLEAGMGMRRACAILMGFASLHPSYALSYGNQAFPKGVRLAKL